MTKRMRIPLFFAVVLGALGLGLVTSTVMADSLPQPAMPITVAVVDDVPNINGLDDASVLDAAEYEVVSDLTQRITPYVSVVDGKPVLADLTADELGVDPVFLNNLRRAMEFSNQAIDDGLVVVNDDMTVEAGSIGPSETRVIGSMSAAEPVMPGELLDGDMLDSSIDWQGWNYPQGSMFYNSYPDYWNHYHNRYYMLANSMAAYLGYPWMSTNLLYFYTYNTSYFRSHCYSNYGMYFYLPYGSRCQSYNPCYGSGMSYRPAYIWVRAYVYYQPCSCYRQNWQWQGYWARY